MKPSKLFYLLFFLGMIAGSALGARVFAPEPESSPLGFIGGPGFFPPTGGSGGGGSSVPTQFPSVASLLHYQTDCVNHGQGGATANPDFLVDAFSGTGATVSSASVAGDPGVCIIRSGSTATTGRSAMRGDTSSAAWMIFDASMGATFFEARVSFTTLPTAANDTDNYWGFIDSITAESTDGVYFRQRDTTSSANIECVVAQAGTRSAVDSGVAFTNGIGNFRKTRLEVDGACSDVRFYIDDVEVCQALATTNCPVGANATSVGLASTNSATVTTGTDFNIDYVEVGIPFPSGR
jgi:hypothetical protein